MSNEEEEDHIEFKGITYLNDTIEETACFDELPEQLQSFYSEINGLVAYNGGFQIRGCGTGPTWNSLEEAWKGQHAFHKTYPKLSPEDIPFAQDCMGDQYVFRAGSVWHLLTETGELDDLELDFDEFIDEVVEDPIEFLALYPLIEFMDSGKELKPGELLVPSAPFTVETDEEYTLTKDSVENRLASLRKYYIENK